MMMTLVAAAALAAAQAPPQSCQAALGPLYEGTEEEALPGQVDGRTVGGRDGLLELRRRRGDALITVRGGDFSGADFSGARLHNICFLDSDLSRSSWSGVEAPGIGFVRANLSNADLRGARMAHILLRQPDLKDSDASGADFSGGKLDGGWDGSVENLKLDGANLTGFRFECGITIDDGCPIQGEISLREANLTEADIGDYGRVSDWSRARIDRTRVSLSELAPLSDAAIAGPIIVRADEAVAELSAADHRRLLPMMRLLGQAPRPSFDCARATSPVERLICSEDGGSLRALDLAVASLYRRAGAGGAQSQQAWLRQRDACPVEGGVADRFCVEESYERRRAALVARLGPPEWIRPGAVAVFVAPPVEFLETFHSDPLYRRLLPVMIGSAWSRVAVRVRGDGSIDARGDAFGANAHSCSLGGDGLRFDPATGWFSGPYEAAGDEPQEWRNRPMPVLLFWGDRAAVYKNGHAYGSEEGDPRSSDYASCGARAGFSEMIRMPVPDAEARALFESMEDLQ